MCLALLWCSESSETEKDIESDSANKQDNTAVLKALKNQSLYLYPSLADRDRAPVGPANPATSVPVDRPWSVPSLLAAWTGSLSPLRVGS